VSSPAAVVVDDVPKTPELEVVLSLTVLLLVVLFLTVVLVAEDDEAAVVARVVVVAVVLDTCAVDVPPPPQAAAIAATTASITSNGRMETRMLSLLSQNVPKATLSARAHLGGAMTDADDSFAFTPADSPLSVADVMTSPVYQDLMVPKVAVGQPAPDLALPRLDAPGERVRLSDFAGEMPVALIFGSYT
jgi:hypothetical protein